MQALTGFTETVAGTVGVADAESLTDEMVEYGIPSKHDCRRINDTHLVNCHESRS